MFGRDRGARTGWHVPLGGAPDGRRRARRRKVVGGRRRQIRAASPTGPNRAAPPGRPQRREDGPPAAGQHRRPRNPPQQQGPGPPQEAEHRQGYQSIATTVTGAPPALRTPRAALHPTAACLPAGAPPGRPVRGGPKGAPPGVRRLCSDRPWREESEIGLRAKGRPTDPDMPAGDGRRVLRISLPHRAAPARASPASRSPVPEGADGGSPARTTGSGPALPAHE